MTRVLVIDDDELTSAILQELLEARDYEVYVAEDGDGGLELARKVKPDLILLDMVMPKMTGFEVLPLLRSHPITKETPVIALTGATTSASRDDAHLAGCDIYVTKPINKENLFRAIDQLIG